MLNGIKYILLTAFCMLLSAVVQGRSYYFKHYQVDEGLLHNNVTCITQDRLGFIWLGTRGGLNRFDGYRFKSYTIDRSKRGTDYIRAIREDRNGLLWVGTASGIFKFDPRTETFQQLSLLPLVNIRDIKIDHHNNLWIIARGMLYQYEQSTGRLTAYDLLTAAFDLDNEEHVWIATVSSALKRLDIRTNKITDIPLKNHRLFEKRSINQIRHTPRHLLIGSIHGLFRYDLGSGTLIPVLEKTEKGAEIFVREIFMTSGNDTCYIATESGLYIYNLGNAQITHLKKIPGDPYSLNDNAIYSVYADRRQGVWLGTFFGGLNYFSEQNNQFEKYYPLNMPGSISGNAVREICADRTGNLWIGTEDAGLNRFDPVTGIFRQIKQGNPLRGPSYPNIHGLLADDDRLFIGPFFHGLEVMDLKNGKIIDRHPRVPTRNNSMSDIVMSIFKTSEGRILVGTTGAGLFEYDRLSRTLIPIKYVPWNSYVYTIAEDHTGTIWTGSLVNGVFYYNPKTGQYGNINFSNLKDTTRNSYIVQGIYEDREKFIWLATEGGGLFKIDSNRRLIKRYTTQTGLPTNNLYRILEDTKGQLWISSLKGLICFNPRTEKIHTYTKSNGLITDQFNYNSAYKAPDGKMYFGSVKGMIAFRPELLGKNQTAPPLYITGLFVGGDTPDPQSPAGLHKSVLFADSLTLKHQQTTFSIEFAALDFASANAVRYRYKMEGMDKTWTYLTENRKAYFTDLPAGTYRFVVQAESNLGYWSSAPKAITITVLPPFWKSTPARIFYVLMLAGLVLLALFLHARNLKKKNQHQLQLFELEKEKEVYHAKIDFFTNVAHEIQTPLTLIKGPVEWALSQIDDVSVVKRNLELVKKNANRLVTLTSQLLDFRKMETNQFALNPVCTNINTLFTASINYFKPELEKRNLNTTIFLPEQPIEAFVDEEAFEKIMSNLLSNAVKYAQKQVVLRLYSEPGCFKIHVMNDGAVIEPEYRKKIFAPFYRIPSRLHLPGTGIGLSLARSLAELHKGSLELLGHEEPLNIFELTLPLDPQQEPEPATENNCAHERIATHH